MEDDSLTSTSQSTPPQMTACRVCCEPIRLGASKCTHCGSYQNWTRYILRWSTVLASLLAIVPLWNMASSLHQIAFLEKTANIEAALTACEQKNVSVAFANSGVLDGIVTKVQLTVQQSNKPNKEYDIRSTDLPESFLVSPQKPPVLVRYQAYIDNNVASLPSVSESKEACSYVVGIEWVDFKGSVQTISKGCSCPP